MKAILGYTQDDILAGRSGYHVIADYLQGVDCVVRPRRDPTAFWPLLRTRIQRRQSFSRWCVGGSFEMEQLLLMKANAQPTVPVHLLWCDRDLGFLDQKLSSPLIGTFHQCGSELDQIITRPAALRRFAHIIIMSHTQRSWFVSQGVPADRVHRILHGVDVDYFHPAPKPQQDRFEVLAVGGTKRHFSLMADVARALLSQPEMHFTIIGPDDQTAPFHGLENVRYLTRISDAELLQQYQTASCLLHLVTDSTANNVINEALACGLPIVSQDHGGVPEYVTPDCALLSSMEQGGSAIVASLHRLAGSQQLQQEMSQAARVHALTLDWRFIAAETQQLYSSAA